MPVRLAVHARSRSSRDRRSYKQVFTRERSAIAGHATATDAFHRIASRWHVPARSDVFRERGAFRDPPERIPRSGCDTGEISAEPGKGPARTDAAHDGVHAVFHLFPDFGPVVLHAPAGSRDSRTG